MSTFIEFFELFIGKENDMAPVNEELDLKKQQQ